MTINSGNLREEYTATAGQTEFTYSFKIFSSSDLNVYQTPAGVDFDDDTYLITSYTVSGVLNEDGGTVTLNSGATAGDRITIVSAIPETRDTDYQVNGDFSATTVNNDFDRVVSLAKQAAELARRSPGFEESSQSATSLTFPSPVANAFLRTKTDLSGYNNYTATTNALLDDIPVASYADARALTSASYTDGQVVTVTDTGIGGHFVIRTGTVTDDGLNLLVFDDDSARYMDRIIPDIVEGKSLFLTEQASAAADVAAKGQFWVKNDTPNVAYFTDDAGTDFNLQTVGGTIVNESIFLTEKASADADVAGDGQLWVKNDTPNKLFFTDDAGTDFDLTSVGKVVQEVNTQTGAVATGTTAMALDDTIPQNTEGTEFMTLAITPTSSSNILVIKVIIGAWGLSTATVGGAALFQDSTANALAGVPVQVAGANSAYNPIVFSHRMTAGTTSSTTFKVRAGGSGGNTFTFNGTGGTRLYGGVIPSSITITEYSV